MAMRLTLRSLLNYMHGQLKDPKDSEEIAKKIEESKYATELFHRIRDVMRRLRLAAPAVNERAPNLDCNTVAEYLDNELPPDRVPAFEEATLPSDMQLAEVASCHQILSMVLCEPVEIDPESRQRMYQLPTVANRVDEERLAAAEAVNMLSGDGAAADSSAAVEKSRPRPVVPEYLREPPRKFSLVTAAAVMLLFGASVGLVLWLVYPSGLQRIQAALWGNSAANEERDEGDRPGAAKPSSSDAVKPSAEGAASPAKATGVGAGLPAKPGDTAHPPAAGETAIPAVAKDTGNPPMVADSPVNPVRAAEKVATEPVATAPAGSRPVPRGSGSARSRSWCGTAGRRCNAGDTWKASR